MMTDHDILKATLREVEKNINVLTRVNLSLYDNLNELQNNLQLMIDLEESIVKQREAKQ